MVLISLMTSGVEHHFICLLAICILSLEKCVNSSEHFEIELFIVLIDALTTFVSSKVSCSISLFCSHSSGRVVLMFDHPWIIIHT